MRYKFIYGFLLLFFQSCELDKESSKEQLLSVNKEIKGSNLIIKKVDNIFIDTLTELRHAYVKDFFTDNNGEHYLKVDFVDFLEGEEALKAEWRDKSYYIDGEDTITNITDGYYISNQNNRLRTFILSKNVIINIFYTPKDSYEFTEVKGASISQFTEELDNDPLIILNIKNGVIETIDEQFIP
jgi:hypothetical protein